MHREYDQVVEQAERYHAASSSTDANIAYRQCQSGAVGYGGGGRGGFFVQVSPSSPPHLFILPLRLTNYFLFNS